MISMSSMDCNNHRWRQSTANEQYGNRTRDHTVEQQTPYWLGHSGMYESKTYRSPWYTAHNVIIQHDIVCSAAATVCIHRNFCADFRVWYLGLKHFRNFALALSIANHRWNRYKLQHSRSLVERKDHTQISNWNTQHPYFRSRYRLSGVLPKHIKPADAL